mgnify:CR=1 FL=1
MTERERILSIMSSAMACHSFPEHHAKVAACFALDALIVAGYPPVPAAVPSRNMIAAGDKFGGSVAVWRSMARAWLKEIEK